MSGINGEGCLYEWSSDKFDREYWGCQVLCDACFYNGGSLSPVTGNPAKQVDIDALKAKRGY
jgi:hypothetical protein